MTILAAAYSSKGGRPHNEDAYLLAAETGGGGTEDTSAVFSGIITAPLLFFVADGMGGHAGGDMASAFVAEKMRDAVAGEKNINAGFLEKIVNRVHAALLEEGKRRGTPDMGATLTGIVLQDGKPSGVYNAGDSRTYRFRNGFIRQLTRDDSLAGIVPGAAKNIITNALGGGLPDVTVASRFAQNIAVAGDVFLMCSDGVHGFVTDDYLEEMLGAARGGPLETARQIVEKALAAGSDDNCTAVVVRIEEQ
jgi:protein phosphatase